MANQALPVLGVAEPVETATEEQRHDAPVQASAEPQSHSFMFSPVIRYSVVLYVAITVPLVAALMWDARDPIAYLRGLLVVGAVFAGPGWILVTLSALRSPPADKIVRWLWALVVFASGMGALSMYQRLQPGLEAPHVARALMPVAAALVCLVIANSLIMRNRSGDRAALVDGVDLVMATIAICTPFALAFGNDLMTSQHAWFTVPAAGWGVVACHGTLVALTIRNRVQPGYRTLAEIGIAFGIAAIVSALGHVVLGLNNFNLPAGPFAGLYALAVGIGTIFFAFTTRQASPGLERLAPGAQVRRNSIIAVVVMVSMPVTAAIVWWHSDQTGMREAGLMVVVVLLVLSSLRHLLAARETTRLYSLVERSAHERGELLAEVMAHVDTDRHRAAAHLHRQAASLYTAMASFTSAIDQAVESGNPTSVSFAADRLRTDLGQRADGLRRLAEAVKPLDATGEEARRLAAPMRAYLEKICGDGPRPELTIDVDPDLTLDWTTEAAVLRIVQEATLNAWWHGGATEVTITVGADGGTVDVQVADNGNGKVPPSSLVVTTMQSVARFLGGDLTSEPQPTGGTLVSAQIPVIMGLANEHRVTPHLRLINKN